MSTPSTERPAGGPQKPASAPKAEGTGFAKKVGPLPIWGWTAIAAAAGIAYILWKRAHPSAGVSGTTSTATSTSSSTATGYGAEIATLQAEIQQLQGGSTSTSTKTSTTTSTKTTASTSTSTITPHKSVSASGTESLNKIAKANGSSAAAIAQFTLKYKTHIGTELKKYLTSGNYQARIPKGLVFWVPTS